jgi:ABC-type multidrug transport system ATPase subunit
MIRVTNLTKRFGEFTALDAVSFEVRDGETMALLGPNGSGKTTTLKSIAGLVTAGAGRVSVGGIDLATCPCEARRLISYLPQRVAFPENFTALEVLRFYCRLRKLPPERADEVLESFHLDSVKDKLVSQFSGGMVQRLGIAVAFLPDAPFLLMDEPTASLDPESAIGFREWIARLRRTGKTILFASHVLSDVDLLADRVAILVGGKVAAVETVGALRDGLVASARMRLSLFNPQERFARVAVAAGASEARLAGNTLVVASKPADRLSIFHRVEEAGALVEHFSTEEPSLEEMYLRYVNEKHPEPLAVDVAGLPDPVPSAC